MQESLEGAGAVVTGHTSGLGEAVAAELLERGARLLGIARRRSPELAGRAGARLVEAQLDLADAAALEQWLRGGSLASFLHGAERALLVNNAGTVQPIGPLESQDAAGAARAVVLNVAAPLALSAAFAQVTEQARERRILHVSSGAGTNAYAGWSVYCATKAALDQHARAVALDATPRLRIGSVAPGIIDTDMQAVIRATPEADFPDRERFVEMKQHGQLVRPEDAARALVEFLLSDAFGREPVTDLRRRTA
jgi:NAD(P)-dependent dehydrogenase (short-subunit alcohol dehydrogenase family)